MQFYLPIAELPVDVLRILFTGAAVGFIAGLFGVGGGFLITPLLIFLGIPPAVAVATTASQIAASSMTGMMAYWRKGQLDFRLGSLLLISGMLGTILGVLFFNNMRRVGQLDTVISISYLVLLGGIGTAMLIESLKALLTLRRNPKGVRRRAGQHAWYEGLPLKMRFHRSGLYISIIPLAILGVFIGFAGAVLGIGGGFIMVPALIYMFRVPAAVVVGTSLFQILFTMLFATVMHAATNQSVDAILALLLIIGGVFGAQFGARAGLRLRGDIFRLALALLIFSVGARFAYDILVPPTELFSISGTETFR